MTTIWQFLFAFGFFWTYMTVADGKSINKLPPYIHACKKSDPKLNECFKKFLESFESKFTTGIPEIGLSPMDPFKKDKLIFKLPGGGHNKFVSTDIVVHGLKDLKIQDVSINPETLQIKLKATLPVIKSAGNYDVDAHVLNMVIKGKGPFKGEADDITINFAATGKLIEKDGEKVLHIADGDGDVTWKKHHLQIDNLFPDKKANDAFNDMVNGPAGISIARSQIPVLKQVVITSVIQYLNEIVERFPIDEILQP